MDWDDTLTRIARVVSAKLQIEEYYVKDVVEHCIKSTKEALRSPEVPAVKWPRFGTFRPSYYKMEEYLKKKLRKYKKGIIKRSTLHLEISKYNQPRRRIREEVLSRRPRARKRWQDKQELRQES